MKLSELIKEIEELELPSEGLTQTTKSGFNITRVKTAFLGKPQDIEVDFLAIQNEKFAILLIVREDNIKDAIYKEIDYFSKNGFINDLEEEHITDADAESTKPFTKAVKTKCLNPNCGYEMAISHSDSVVPYANYKCPCCGSGMSKPFDYSKPKELIQKAQEVVEEAKKHDVVNNPNHYKRGEIECFEALKASMTKEQFLGHLKATAIAYLWRYDLKNGLEDVKKAKWYVDKMVKELENQ